ncbi:hypothetical protein CYLTODRAFT_446542 [Cylindrobasidium torrendii FP15055 ss-10]|uniref:Uncharacterized protein n=1 Tax=Cylindrobasidium torrendii FP15055 ss-10 TaxID=1314674 RepID=A0A0D7AYW1_9AGAR|nr:hypothetical protein CYLTODRAFT_446542 [Cylindrobasidium torrendii FP15055 ss-10]
MPSHSENGERSKAASGPLEGQSPSDEETSRVDHGPGTLAASVSRSPAASPPFVNPSSSGVVSGATTNVRAVQDESNVHSASSHMPASNIHTVSSPGSHSSPAYASSGETARSPATIRLDALSRRFVVASIEEQRVRRLRREIAAEKKRFRRHKRTLEEDEKRQGRPSEK